MKKSIIHPSKRRLRYSIGVFAIGLAFPLVLLSRADEGQRRRGKLIQFGSMHETIGKQNHEPRVSLADVLKTPHFHGVGAVDGLRGEITILDSNAVVTGIDKEGKLRSLIGADTSATLLVGQSVSKWKEVPFSEDVSARDVDKVIGELAEENGIDTASPFAFIIEGSCSDVRLHVINGACPVHARMKKIATPEETKPYELEARSLEGTIIGIFAKDAVGELTHPETSQHAHLVYSDKKSGARVTGHLERYGIKKGAVLRLPVFVKQDGE